MILQCKKVNNSRNPNVSLELILSEQYKIQCNSRQCNLIDRWNKTTVLTINEISLDNLIALINKGVKL